MLISPNLSLPYIDVNAAQREVVHNEAIRGLDALVQLAVLDRSLATPPGSPGDGERWIVAASPTGAWSGHATEVAAWQDGAWRFFEPRTGWLVYVVDEGVLLAWNGSAWVDALSLLTTIQNVSLFGVGTTADAANPFSAKLNNALWVAKTVAEGGDGHLRYKMSKESATKTLSLLMQTNYSGRAEIGLTGDDDFHVKVSPDGSTWYDSLVISCSSGNVGLAVDGSASAPALSWSSDPDNGFYRTGSNAWSLACAGAQAIGIAATVISIPYATAATSPTTGAVTIAGGLGVGGAGYFGGILRVLGGSSGVASAVIGLGAQGTAAQASLVLTGRPNNSAVPTLYFDTGTNGQTIGMENAAGQLGIYGNGDSWTQIMSLSPVNNGIAFNQYANGTLSIVSGVVTTSSDIAMKTDPKPFRLTIADMLAHFSGHERHGPIEHGWDADKSGIKTDARFIGFAAQDYAEWLPMAVGRDERGNLSLDIKPILAVHDNTLVDHEQRLVTLESRSR
jgi:hypothetical protein